MSYEYKLHGKSGPLIVIENGLGNSMYGWNQVIDGLKSKARILTYHRKGYGKSPFYDVPRSVSQISKELVELLDFLNIDESFILVGHSFGGLIAQYFTLKYAEKVSNLILVDSTSRNFKRLVSSQTPTLNEALSDDNFASEWASISQKDYADFLSSFGDIDNSCDSDMKSFMLTQQNYKTAADEILSFEKSSSEIKDIHRTLHMDLHVLARDPKQSIQNFSKYGLPENETSFYEETWLSLQKEMLALSTNSYFHFAQGSDHCIMEDKPDLVIDVIEKCIKKASLL